MNDPWAVDGDAGRPPGPPSRGRRSCRRCRAAAARTSPGSSTGCRGAYARLGVRTPGRAGRRHPRRARSTSTSGRSRSAPGCSPASALGRARPSARPSDRRPTVTSTVETSTTTCPRQPSRRSRSSHATRPACWSTPGPDTPPDHRTVADLPVAASARATCWSSTTPGSSRPGCGCARRPAARSRCCCSSARRGAPLGGAGAAEPAGRRRARRLSRRATCGSRWATTSATGRRSGATVPAGDPVRPRRGRRSRRTSTEPLADPERYQTVFARRAGSVAAPTAGLHLTDRRARRLPAPRAPRWRRSSSSSGSPPSGPSPPTGWRTTPCTPRRYDVPAEVLERVRGPPSGWSRSAPRSCGRSSRRPAARPAGRTDLFIHGDFEFRLVDRLLTNFHVPRSSLLALVDAFVGPALAAAVRHGPAPRATAS